MILEYCQFVPAKQVGSFIGFMSLKIGREYSWYRLGVHILKSPKGNTKIRLVYPEMQAPPTRIMQSEIDEEVSAYISANYPESLRSA